MTPNDIITWLRDQAIRAPEDVLKRGMIRAADMLEALSQRNAQLEEAAKNSYTVQQIEEIQKEAYDLGVDSVLHNHFGLTWTNAEALRKQIAEIQEQHRWIPVTERLPQENLPVGALCDVVQVLLQNGFVTVGWHNRWWKCWFYLPVDKTEFVGHGYDLTPVVAWKPLSEPPKEVER